MTLLVAMGLAGLIAVIGSSACLLFAGKREMAPHLRSVHGRRAASPGIFLSSQAIRKTGGTWETDTLDKPRAFSSDFAPDSGVAFLVKSSNQTAAITSDSRGTSVK